jgi:hypothetical protein
MRDASTLQRTDVDEATALALMGEAADPEGRHKHHKHHRRGKTCRGVCMAGMCVASHAKKHCCHGHKADTYAEYAAAAAAADDADEAADAQRKWHCWS